MARTEIQIYNELAQEKDTFATLAGLQPASDTGQSMLSDLESASQVADWRLWLWVVSKGTRTLEVLFDLFKEEVNEIALKAHYGTVPWYRDQALAFQNDGQPLVYIDGKFTYAVINPAFNVVKRCSITEAGGNVIIKTATIISGALAPLITVDFDAFKAYMRKIRVAGSKLIFVNQGPDYLNLTAKVYYDPMVLAPDGSLLSNPSVRPVDLAIQNYLDTLPFNGEIRTNGIIDAAQSVVGVIDFYIVPGGCLVGDPSLGLTDLIVSRVPFSGYYIVDPALPLIDGITYQPYA